MSLLIAVPVLFNQFPLLIKFLLSKLSDCWTLWAISHSPAFNLIALWSSSPSNSTTLATGARPDTTKKTQPLTLLSSASWLTVPKYNNSLYLEIVFCHCVNLHSSSQFEGSWKSSIITLQLSPWYSYFIWETMLLFFWVQRKSFVKKKIPTLYWFRFSSYNYPLWITFSSAVLWPLCIFARLASLMKHLKGGMENLWPSGVVGLQYPSMQTSMVNIQESWEL